MREQLPYFYKKKKSRKKQQKKIPTYRRQFKIEIDSAHHWLSKDDEACWRHLERAHILGQKSVWRHLCIHIAMFVFGLTLRDWREALGQIPRIILAVPSTLFGFIPLGNVGRARVGMLQEMPVPADLQHFLLM